MGKVIEFDPSRRRKNKEDEKELEKNEPKKEPELHEEALLKFFASLQKYSDSMGENDPAGLMIKLTFNGIMLHDKIGEIERNTENFSQEIFKKREKTVSSYTNDQLVNFLIKSNSTEWHKDPAFYRAIVNEVRERMRMIVKGDE